MLFQQHMRLPIDAELLHAEGDISEDHLDEAISVLLNSREETFRKAEANIKTAQTNQKETYDCKHGHQILPEGSQVLLENTAQKERKGGKMDKVWLGPYVINQHLGKGVYELRNMDGSVMKKKVNINRLKPYIQREENIDTSNKDTPQGDLKTLTEISIHHLIFIAKHSI